MRRVSLSTVGDYFSGGPSKPVVEDEDDWFSTPYQEPGETREVMWEDEVEEPYEAAAPGLGQRQALVVLAVLAIVVVVAVAILVVKAVGGSDGTTVTPPASTVPTTAPVATTPTTSTPAVTTPTSTRVPTDAKLLAGSKGPAVTALQQALNELGYDAGAADGSFGPTTTAAVTAFQKAEGLVEDGIAGANTLAAINAAVAG